MTGNELRAAVVATARAWLGCKEADGSFWEIVKYYNDHRPPGDYTMQYVDPWCAAFVSAVGMYAVERYKLACKPYELIPASAACDPMIEAYQRLGRWVENDAYLPSPGDVIFYDWQDSGSGDNQGSADHVGIVAEVSGDTIVVIEGNYSDQVKQRTIKRNGRYIRGYGTPDYDRWAATAGVEPQEGDVIIIVDTPVNGTSGNAADSADSQAQNSHSAEIDENGTSGSRATAFLPVLRKGDGVGNPSEIVRAAQLLLIGRGFGCGRWGADGEFGGDTYTAVLLFQFSRGLNQDGEIGPQTWAALLGIN